MSSVFDYDDECKEPCFECFGEGGWNRCAEDCCPVIGGEDGCDDPACWRVCGTCRGTGYLHCSAGEADHG